MTSELLYPVSLNTFPILKDLLNECPSQWHASQKIDFYLQKNGFEKASPHLNKAPKEGQGYFMEVGPGARIAFIARSKANSLSLIGCHTESPMLRIKENGFLQEEGIWMAHVEAYGSPILASWLFKDLGLCGRVLTQTATGIREHFINIKEPLGLLLTPAIHLDRDMNQKGLIVDKQKHLKVLLGSDNKAEHPLRLLLKKTIGEESILDHELFFYPLEKASSLKLDPQWVASWRIDNLASCSACLEALIESRLNDTSPLSITLFADHEEIGSETFSGAASQRYILAIENILSWLGYTNNESTLLKQKALLYSVDGAHGLHPSYKNLYEPSHLPKLGQGVVIKFNPSGRYSTDGRTAARLRWLAHQANVPLQNFHMKADLPCGSTIGPILSTHLGVEGVDIGLPQLAMHASREMMHLQDYQNLKRLLIYAIETAPATIETSQA